MTSFIHDDFLLQTDFARKLYHNYAAALPLIDYHCHLSPQAIAQNRNFKTLTEIWLEGDHYKWRAMRTLGIPEKYITGNARDEEKFSKWAYTVPFTVRNPLYHWTHLELSRYFGVNELLTTDTSASIYQTCNEQLAHPDFSTQGLIKRMNVEVVCTTDDPVDNLSYHQQIRESDFEVLVLPAFRPDKAYAFENPAAYKTYIAKLAEVSGVSINSCSDLISALENRVAFFHANGCRLADHGIEKLDYPLQGVRYSTEDLFKNVLNDGALSSAEIEWLKYTVMLELSRMYHANGWTQQFHLGALRNTNDRMMRTLGPDTGFDSIGDWEQSKTLARFLNELDSTNQLTRTILYNLNPAQNEVMATMTGNFNDGSTKGKVQFGSAWWFLDQKDGIEKQLNSLSNLGLLSCFIGMLTDSRSFLSYPRHEYFRRVLCNLIGNDVANGELPSDEKWLGKIVSDICYHNAKSYFGFTPVSQNAFNHA